MLDLNLLLNKFFYVNIAHNHTCIDGELYVEELSRTVREW
jgi:hypothetical protein